MTRLANIEKAGFFPLPPVVTDLILTYLTAPHRGRVLAPCTSEGVAFHIPFKLALPNLKSVR